MKFWKSQKFFFVLSWQYLPLTTRQWDWSTHKNGKYLLTLKVQSWRWILGQKIMKRIWAAGEKILQSSYRLFFAKKKRIDRQHTTPKKRLLKQTLSLSKKFDLLTHFILFCLRCMPQILSLLDENHGNDIINRTNQWGNRMKTMTYSCLQILFVSLLNCNRSSFYPHVNHFFISVIFPLILGKYFVKLIWKLNLNEISSYAQWQCGNFGNFPPLKFFFVKLIYS